MQASHQNDNNLQSISERNTERDSVGSFRPQPSTSSGLWNTVRTDGGQRTLLSAQATEQRRIDKGTSTENYKTFNTLNTDSIFKEPKSILSREEKIEMALDKPTKHPVYLDIIKLGQALGLKAEDISFTVKFGLSNGTAIN